MQRIVKKNLIYIRKNKSVKITLFLDFKLANSMANKALTLVVHTPNPVNM